MTDKEVLERKHQFYRNGCNVMCIIALSGCFVIGLALIFFAK